MKYVIRLQKPSARGSLAAARVDHNSMDPIGDGSAVFRGATRRLISRTLPQVP